MRIDSNEHHPTFEEVWPKAEFSELIRLFMALLHVLVRFKEGRKTHVPLPDLSLPAPPARRVAGNQR